MVTLLRSRSFNAKELINIDHNEVRYNKTVVDFILGLHGVLKLHDCTLSPMLTLGY